MSLQDGDLGCSTGLQKFSVILVGNKADLPAKERVSRDAVRELSVQYGCLHIEASAKLRLNIDSIFRCLLMKEAPPPRLSQQQDVRRRWPEEADTVKPTFLCVRNK